MISDKFDFLARGGSDGVQALLSGFAQNIVGLPSSQLPPAQALQLPFEASLMILGGLAAIVLGAFGIIALAAKIFDK